MLRILCGYPHISGQTERERCEDTFKQIGRSEQFPTLVDLCASATKGNISGTRLEVLAGGRLELGVTNTQMRIQMMEVHCR